ncbi:DNA-protecting protein DprA [Ornithinimicrobium sp. Arc0846-15]|nr:DNA-protecting protein DprA [Ornithinimicrobium laminariae]
MDNRQLEVAFLCAVLEVLPAASRDLSDLLVEAKSVEALIAGDVNFRSRSGALYRYILKTVDTRRVDHWRAQFENLTKEWPDLRFVTVVDPEYPPLVQQAYDRPPLMFFRGSLPKGPATAIVGSRNTSPEAYAFAAETARQLVEAGHVIISGLARGIDESAHSACLHAGGRTVAVLGHALDVDLSPSEHSQLGARIIDCGGALVSPFRPGSPATTSSFVQRNTVISAFADVSVVVTADERSGSWSELQSALAQGREVVLPRFVVDESSSIQALVRRERRVHAADTPWHVAQIATRALNTRRGTNMTLND